jgi:predicted nucleotide-binding protein
MYYHVLIETKDIDKYGKNVQIFELDNEDKHSIVEDTILPYINNQEFQFNGYFLSKDLIARIVIIESSQSSDNLSEIANSEIPAGVILYISPSQAIQDNKYTKDITKEVFKIAYYKNKNVKKTNNIDDNTNKESIFVVHGHDDLVKLEVSSFIKELGFNPIILHEQASGGATIIEKIESYSSVGYGVVLYTPCDIGGKNEETHSLLPRARQNVVFEHVYLIGKLKRGNVCALVKGDIETPNDISGVVYINYDNAGSWKIPLAKELRKAGYDVDMNKVI